MSQKNEVMKRNINNPTESIIKKISIKKIAAALTFLGLTPLTLFIVIPKSIVKNYLDMIKQPHLINDALVSSGIEVLSAHLGYMLLTLWFLIFLPSIICTFLLPIVRENTPYKKLFQIIIILPIVNLLLIGIALHYEFALGNENIILAITAAITVGLYVERKEWGFFLKKNN